MNKLYSSLFNDIATKWYRENVNPEGICNFYDLTEQQQQEVSYDAHREIFLGLALLYYSKNTIGGHLHIVLDDGNLENSAIYLCQGWCIENKDWIGDTLCKLLLGVDMSEREGYYEDLRELTSQTSI